MPGSRLFHALSLELPREELLERFGHLLVGLHVLPQAPQPAALHPAVQPTAQPMAVQPMAAQPTAQPTAVQPTASTAGRQGGRAADADSMTSDETRSEKFDS
ncbi:unnamed protein product [Durusdinium trenchii]|uniref:Uncharacterized protein n=2 Tax=Durusdinium trenchii TaxID=1381693 RepID=A0ABP0RW86_9DINO